MRMRSGLVAILFTSAVAAGACKENAKPGESAGSSATHATSAGSAADAAGSASTVTAADAATVAADVDAASTLDSPVAAVTADAVVDDGVADMGTGADGRGLYYARPLTAADLDHRTLRDLALMRNTVYARAGHRFRKAWLHDHFTAMSWYEPHPKDDETKITDVDRANTKLIAEREVAVPHDELVARRAALQAAAAPSEAEQVELRLLNEQLGDAGASVAGGTAKASPLEDPGQLDRLLTLDELGDFSKRDLRILRNTVYARHGRTFKSDTLIQWFDEKPWYKADPAFTEASLTAIDRKNVRLIRSVEDSLGGPMSEHDQKADEGWFDDA